MEEQIMKDGETIMLKSILARTEQEGFFLMHQIGQEEPMLVKTVTFTFTNGERLQVQVRRNKQILIGSFEWTVANMLIRLVESNHPLIGSDEFGLRYITYASLAAEYNKEIASEDHSQIVSAKKIGVTCRDYLGLLVRRHFTGWAVLLDDAHLSQLASHIAVNVDGN